MNAINQILGYPLGWVMWLMYQITSNYGISLFLFTLLIRLLIFPLSLKQQKSTVKMTILKPQISALQDKYKNNKEKLNEEMMALYSKEGYNPASGCLPLLIQMPILFGLIDVIYRPLKHILRMSDEAIAIGTEIVKANGGSDAASRMNQVQLYIIKGVQETPELFKDMGADAINAIHSLQLNFLGLDLTATPSTKMLTEIFTNFNPILLIPVLSGLSALAVSLISMKYNPMDQAGGASMKGMMLTMPIVSTIFTFSVPAGVGLYWFYANVVSMLQSIVLNKFYNPKEMAAKAQAEYDAKHEAERMERIEAKKQLKEGKLDGAQVEKALSQKEINRKRLAQARKEDAEKYGDVYVEVTDEDL